MQGILGREFGVADPSLVAVPLLVAVLAEDMAAEGKASPDTLIAMGILVGGLLDGQRRAQEAFSARFALFSERSNQELFSELFKSKVRET